MMTELIIFENEFSWDVYVVFNFVSYFIVKLHPVESSAAAL